MEDEEALLACGCTSFITNLSGIGNDLGKLSLEITKVTNGQVTALAELLEAGAEVEKIKLEEVKVSDSAIKEFAVSVPSCTTLTTLTLSTLLNYTIGNINGPSPVSISKAVTLCIEKHGSLETLEISNLYQAHNLLNSCHFIEHSGRGNISCLQEEQLDNHSKMLYIYILKYNIINRQRKYK
eukprot:TRINITY_DN318_c0_g2_i1.p1 TRINITY_DN318_c0_g2~~TRINITY_DN318_c0_g2_i1.p1  ORF type:complete len:208 (+),score=15.83 TRINITY_DN318_c0_g2_i1:79-624(+)